MRKVGRPAKPIKERSKNAGIAFYPKEIRAVKALAEKRAFRTTSDCLRSLLIADGDSVTRGKIVEPRRD